MFELGRIVAGDKKAIEKAIGKWAGQKVDDRRVVAGEDAGFSAKRTTIGGPVSVTGPGTFYGKAKRTLVFRPSSRPGWWIKRTDQFEQLPVEVCP